MMKPSLLLFVLILGTSTLFAQLENTFASLDKEDVLFGSSAPEEASSSLIPPWEVDTPPEFKGGHKALLRYFSKQLSYTEQAMQYAVEGLMILRLIVDEKGKPAEVEVLRGLGFGMDEHTASRIRSMPRWKPARVDGRPVSTTCILPLRFRLSP